jgi:hypothetical protein
MASWSPAPRARAGGRRSERLSPPTPTSSYSLTSRQLSSGTDIEHGLVVRASKSLTGRYPQDGTQAS